jgi:hypothetical protein
MAVTSDATTVAPPEQDVLTFTGHELAFLLAMAPGEGAERTRGVLQLTLPADGDGLLAAGAATLLVRELASINAQGLVQPSESCGLIGLILSSLGAWIEIALVSDVETDAAFVLFTPTASLAITPRAVGTFEFRFIRPGVSAGAATAALLFAYLEARAPAAAYAHLVAGGDDVALALRLLSDGALEFSRDEGADLISGSLLGDRDRIRDVTQSVLDAAVQKDGGHDGA